MPVASNIINVYGDTYVDNSQTNPVSAVSANLLIGYGIDKNATGIRRPFLKFDISSVPKYATIRDASLFVTVANGGLGFNANLYIWEYNQEELNYANITFGCTNYVSPLCLGEEWSGGVDDPENSLNGTFLRGFAIPDFIGQTTEVDVSEKLDEYCQNRENYGNYIQFFFKKQSEDPVANNVIKKIYSKESSVSSVLKPYISYTYTINNTLDEITEEILNLGGLGQINFAKNQEDNHMFVIRTVSGSGIEDAPTFISGVPILTSMYNNFRAIHVYKNSESNSVSRQGVRTVYKGIPMQTSTTNNTDYYLNTAKEPTILNSDSLDTEKKILFGNLFINLDNSNRMLVLEKSGSPLETAKIYIGGNPVTVGRFNDGWAIGIDY
jgi:hypothetical protein